MCPTPGLINTSCPMVEGCTSAQADNYNPAATIEDGSCVYLEQNGVIINNMVPQIVIMTVVIVVIMKTGLSFIIIAQQHLILTVII